MKPKYFVAILSDVGVGLLNLSRRFYRCYSRKYIEDPDELPIYWDGREIWNGDDFEEGRRVAKEANAARKRGEK